MDKKEKEKEKENKNEKIKVDEKEKENIKKQGKENEKIKEDGKPKKKEKKEKEEKEVKTFKIITLGNSGVGKTSIINRYIKNQFDTNIASTLGMNFDYKEIHFNNKDKIILKLLDTAGQEKYKSLAKSYFKNADAVLFVFSVDDKESFNTINEWMESFNSINSKINVPRYLVGNKNDLERKIEQNSIDEFARNNKIQFVSTSAKTKNNIDELFEEIGKKLYIDFLTKGDKGQNSINIKIIKKDQQSKCCLGRADT